MSNSTGDSGIPDLNEASVRLMRFPESARLQIRNELQRIRLQLEHLDLDEAELEVRKTIVTVCDALDIPHYLSVQQLKDIP